MTSRKRIANLARGSVSVALVLALVFVLPAFGAEADTSTTPPSSSIGTPKTTPAPDAVSIGPSASPDSVSIGRTAPEPSVIGEPGVDKTTKEFRDKLAAQQARLDAFNAQLDALDNELSIATEAYNDATDKLAEMNEMVHTAEINLAQANADYDRISAILGDQMGTMYRSGTYSPVEILLDSKSLSDFISRVKFLNTVGTDSAQVLEDYTKTRDELQQQVFSLRNSKRMAESLEFELKARKIEVELRIQDRQQLFAATQSDLLGLLAAEASRRQVEETALLQSILSGASKAGISVIPGTPVETVLAYHGVPYLWGGATPAGFDCSGLILYVMQQHGVDLPHYSGSQFLLGEKVLPGELQPGDVVFFGSPVHHVGMYIGGGYFIHAPRTGDYVKISRLADRSDFAGARRYPWQPRIGPIKLAVHSPSEALSGIK